MMTEVALEGKKLSSYVYMGTGPLNVMTARGEVKAWPGDMILELETEREKIEKRRVVGGIIYEGASPHDGVVIDRSAPARPFSGSTAAKPGVRTDVLKSGERPLGAPATATMELVKDEQPVSEERLQRVRTVERVVEKLVLTKEQAELLFGEATYLKALEDQRLTTAKAAKISRGEAGELTSAEKAEILGKTVEEVERENKDLPGHARIPAAEDKAKERAVQTQSPQSLDPSRGPIPPSPSDAPTAKDRDSSKVDTSGKPRA